MRRHFLDRTNIQHNVRARYISSASVSLILFRLVSYGVISIIWICLVLMRCSLSIYGGMVGCPNNKWCGDSLLLQKPFLYKGGAFSFVNESHSG